MPPAPLPRTSLPVALVLLLGLAAPTCVPPRATPTAPPPLPPADVGAPLDAGVTHEAERRAPPGAPCQGMDWVCLARCTVYSCVEDCLAPACREALGRYAACTRKAGCGVDDEACAQRACREACAEGIGTARGEVDTAGGQGAETPTPAGRRKPTVEEALVGRWRVTGASIRPEEIEEEEDRLDPEPRPDFARQLTLKPDGTFTLFMRLRAPTLGVANDLTVTTRGALHQLEQNPPGPGTEQLVLEEEEGVVEGRLCGEALRRPLPAPALRTRGWALQLEEDTLTLTSTDAARQVLQWKRVEEGRGAPRD